MLVLIVSSASLVTSHVLWGNDEDILCMQDLMGSADSGGSKLHPADRIASRRSGGLPVPKGLGLVGRDA